MIRANISFWKLQKDVFLRKNTLHFNSQDEVQFIFEKHGFDDNLKSTFLCMISFKFQIQFVVQGNPPQTAQSNFNY